MLTMLHLGSKSIILYSQIIFVQILLLYSSLGSKKFGTMVFSSMDYSNENANEEVGMQFNIKLKKGIYLSLRNGHQKGDINQVARHSCHGLLFVGLVWRPMRLKCIIEWIKRVGRGFYFSNQKCNKTTQQFYQY